MGPQPQIIHEIAQPGDSMKPGVARLPVNQINQLAPPNARRREYAGVDQQPYLMTNIQRLNRYSRSIPDQILTAAT